MTTLLVDAVTVDFRASRSVLRDRSATASPNQPALRDVSVTVSPGRVLAVTGASGAGKSTLLWTMAGLLQPTTGQVRVAGDPLRDHDHAVAQRVVLIPRDGGLAAILTVAENMRVALVSAGVAPADLPAIIAESLERVDLSGHAHQLVEELSGGQRQRAGLARGLAVRSAVLLVDEVTSELDARSRELVLDLLRQEARRGAAVVFATHDPLAADACDAEVHLVDGCAHVVRP